MLSFSCFRVVSTASCSDFSASSTIEASCFSSAAPAVLRIWSSLVCFSIFSRTFASSLSFSLSLNSEKRCVLKSCFRMASLSSAFATRSFLKSPCGRRMTWQNWSALSPMSFPAASSMPVRNVLISLPSSSSERDACMAASVCPLPRFLSTICAGLLVARYVLSPSMKSKITSVLSEESA